jgi:hypothetical protein
VAGKTSSEDRSECTCGLGSGNVLGVPSGVVPDTTGIRLQNAAGTPWFDLEGQVQGRLEVVPTGETDWGTIRSTGTPGFDSNAAQVACQQLGDQLGFTLTASAYVLPENTDDASSSTEIWWWQVGCDGSEASIQECSHEDTSSTDHDAEVGVSCTFLAPGDECEECVAGKFSATSGVAACASCAAGSYSTIGAASCQQVRWGG